LGHLPDEELHISIEVLAEDKNIEKIVGIVEEGSYKYELGLYI
jgi:hypothetical protein